MDVQLQTTFPRLILSRELRVPGFLVSDVLVVIMTRRGAARATIALTIKSCLGI
jgi:hypothetical protein